jgi:hypothetical protein
MTDNRDRDREAEVPMDIFRETQLEPTPEGDEVRFQLPLKGPAPRECGAAPCREERA